MTDIDEQNTGKVVQRVIEDEMKASYLDYSMSVIVGRALPDVRDGLKPVHRRILYAMQQMGMFHNKSFKKCARIVGEVLGKFHPHGDSSVYDALVRMVQPFSLRYPLIRGQGNFGSVDGDSAAAMRYTEAKLKKMAEEMLQDIEKETVDFVDNFDGSLQEPAFLPAKIPNLLLNGSSGIAVGMATNIPPHNLNEVADATIHLIDYPEAEVKDLMEFVKGPDFPTAGIISGTEGIKHAYAHGRGKVIIKAKTHVEEGKKRNHIIVTELPYMVNKALLVEAIAHLVRDKKLKGIVDLRDESSREGMRIVISLRKDVNTDVILNQLYKHSRMRVTFGMNMLALVENEPQTLNLKNIIHHFIIHRRTVVRKRTQFDLTKAEDRAHILEGLLVALNRIDETIALIKKSNTADEARQVLISTLKITVKQASAILEMRLQRLTGLEQEKIKTEHKDLSISIEKLKFILADEKEILKIIKSELVELKEKFGDERRTVITEDSNEMEPEDFIEKQDVVISITHAGYIKRQATDVYRSQRRGGKGVIAATTRDEDFVEELFTTHTHSHLLFFTNKGSVRWLKVHEIPDASRIAKGIAIVNLLQLESNEKITAFVPVENFEKGYLFMATKKGVVKKTPIKYFSRPRKTGIIALGLKEGDELIGVQRTDGEKDIMLATKKGMAIRFKESNVRSMGRSATGVRGVTLKSDDKVIGMVVADNEETLFTITENGYGKRTKIAEYRVIGRGGKGVINIICSERNGKVIAIKSVKESSDLMLMSQKGIGIRINVKDISVIGRSTQGVRIMKLKPGDKVAAVANVATE